MAGVGRSVARAEDEARMEQLYSLHGHALYRLALRYTLGDGEAARDLVQETLLRAWKHMNRLTPDPAALRPWLFTVARRIAIDGLRERSSRAPEVKVDMSDVSDFRDHSERVATVSTVRAALRRLTPEHRQVLVGLYYEDGSVAQVAGRLGIPEGTVKSRTHHAMRALRATLSSEALTVA